MRSSNYIAILFAVCLLLFFFRLGDMALTDPDETFYAQTAREMLVSGEWITPLIFGKPQFEKPPLYYWFVLLSYMIFGINEFAARFPSAVFGIIGVLGVYFLGRFFFSSLCGFFSGLILAASVQYLILSRACVTDMVLAVFILYCLLFFLLGWEKGGKAYYIVSSVMAALAVLTKGPIGLFIPGAVLGLYILFCREWKKIRNIPLIWCALVFLAVSLPWHIAVVRIHGTAFIDEFFGFHNVTRFLVPEHVIGISPFFYFPVIVIGFYPWTFFLPLGAWDMYKDRGAPSAVKGRGSFLLIWFLVIFLFFSISRTKLVTYIFPLFPVTAIVAGRFWERFVSRGGEDKALSGRMSVSYCFFVVFNFLAAVGAYFFVRREYPAALEGTILAAVMFAAGLLLSLLFFVRARGALSLFSVIIAVILLFFPLSTYVLPVIEEFESSKTLSLRVKELAKADEAVGGQSDIRRGIAFYADRVNIADIHIYSEQVDFFSRKERVWGIIKDKDFEQLRRDKPSLVVQPLLRSGKKVLLTNGRSR